MKRLLVLLLFAFSFNAFAEEADLVLKNGTIITMDDSVPEAISVAVKGEKIVWVGNTADVSKWTGKNTKVLDLNGAFVYPGFIESHAHIVGLGQSRSILDLVGTSTKDAILKMVGDRAKTIAKDAWILGRGWDQNDWPVKEFPTAADLDSVSAGHPVVLERVDGHAIWVNNEVFKRANVTLATKDPDGGKIIRDDKGNPAGVLVDTAAGLVERVMPPPTKQDLLNFTKAALQEAASKGITMIHDAGTSGQALEAFKQLASSSELPVRIYSMISHGSPFAETFLNQGPANYGPYLDVRSMKMYMDGALGSRGAALLAPYSDDPKNSGLILVQDNVLMDALQRAKKSGIQVGIHAIGDRANRNVLDAYQKIGSKGLRWRIEHVQVLAPSDIPRLSQLEVIASMQPTHATSDGPWATDRLGPERVKGAYAWRSLLDKKTIIAGGSDAPVEEINPLWGFYSAITRQDHQGKPEGGWHPEQLVTAKEALRMFTMDAAYSAFREKDLGSISVGKLADMVVLPENILTCAPTKLIDMKVRYTITGGKIRYSSKP
jgi:predicted amidohydrolase YtcJ